jgi:hypothetical protein
MVVIRQLWLKYNFTEPWLLLLFAYGMVLVCHTSTVRGTLCTTFVNTLPDTVIHRTVTVTGAWYCRL